jgi:hypothetical protein
MPGEVMSVDTQKLSLKDFRLSLAAAVRMPVDKLFGQDSEWSSLGTDGLLYSDTVLDFQRRCMQDMVAKCSVVMLFIQRATKPHKYRHLLLRRRCR